MHEALRIHDIIAIVMEQVTYEPKTMHRYTQALRRRDLLSMALTCKAWLDVGLDALWEEITDLSNLLILIPEWQEYRRAQDRLLHAFYADQDDRYELYSKLQLRLQQQDLLQNSLIRPVNLSRFFEYSRRVRKLRLQSDVPIPDAVHTIIDTSKEYLCHKLRVLDIRAGHFPSDATATLFITSHLTHVTINTRADMLRALVEAAPLHLEHIEVSSPELDPPGLTLLSQLRSLRSISIAVDVPTAREIAAFVDAMRCIWRMPFVSSLSLGFHLVERDVELPNICASQDDRAVLAVQTYRGNLATLHSVVRIAPRATRLQIFPQSRATDTQWNQTMKSVFRHSDLEHLEVQQERDQDMTRPAVVLLQMPRFEQLQTLILNVAFDWTDDVFDHIARSCPNATRMSFVHRSPRARVGARLTSEVLVSFATRCKRLRSLRVPLPSADRLSPGLLAVSRDVVCNTSVEELYLCGGRGDWKPASRYKHLIGWLTRLFPNLGLS